MVGNQQMTADPWQELVGQEEAIHRLRAAVNSAVHAYMFIGPNGVGKRQAAFIFAGELFAAADPNTASRHRGLAQKQRHPDIVVFSPRGNNLRLGTASSPGEVPRIIEQGYRSPTEGSRKVLVVEQFQSADPPACSALLKLIEEPPQSTLFVLLASDVPTHQVTIESRCLRVDFASLSHQDIAQALQSEFQVDSEAAQTAAQAANGSIGRARLLIADPSLVKRRNAWLAIPERLNHKGTTVMAIVDEIVDLIDDAEKAVFVERHERERKELDELEEQLGTRGSGKSAQLAQQKREVRRFRTEELRYGFATLASRYRQRVVEDENDTVALSGIGQLKHCSEALNRNPREMLLLQSLFVKLLP